MNEIDFRIWLLKKDTNKKVVSDLVSRLKRIEKEINHCDIDYEYHSDKCEKLLSYFYKKGINAQMETIETSLPIGKYQLSTYRYALKKYIAFLDEFTLNNQ